MAKPFRQNQRYGFNGQSHDVKERLFKRRVGSPLPARRSGSPLFAVTSYTQILLMSISLIGLSAVASSATPLSLLNIVVVITPASLVVAAGMVI